MIFSLKKVIFIALLFVTVNEVNGTPTPFLSDLWEGAGNLLTKAKDAMKNLFFKTASKTVSAVAPAAKILFKKFNCFSITQFFDKAIDIFFTENTTASSVKFYFASNSRPNYTTVIIQNETASFDDVDFDPYLDTVLISHGFMSSGTVDWIAKLKNAFFKYDNCNVIVVDWEEGSNTWNYIGAAATTKTVGNEVAKLFGYIYDQLVKDKVELDLLGNLHFVGHSLGAHIVARAANVIKNDTLDQNRSKNWYVRRITGLDPAQPCFIWAEDDRRLDETDADFVDVIHTNARHILLIGLGMPRRIGHLDFYPNGGQMQPGCSEYGESIWNYRLRPRKMVNATVCSHGRSYEFLTESILAAVNNTCSFISHPWDRNYNESFDELMHKTCAENDCPQMGINSINWFPRTNGIFFTPTGHKSPYCVMQESDKKLIEDQLKHDAALKSAIEAIG